MNIAILTQPLGHNYGGLLQAWALQSLLIEHGHRVLILNRLKPPKSFPFRLAKKLKKSDYSLC